MSNLSIVDRLRGVLPAINRFELDEERIISLTNEAADLLEAFFEQMRCEGAYMNGQHQWRLHNGWPMTHCKGPTKEDAMRAMVAKIKREREAQEET